MSTEEQRAKAKERKRRQRDRQRDADVTVGDEKRDKCHGERDTTPDMSQPDVTPSRCMDCGTEVPVGDNTCVDCYVNPRPAYEFKGGYHLPFSLGEAKRRPPTYLPPYEEAGPTANYKPPIDDWKGMGWCRDCNQAVVAKSNYCGC